MHTTIEDDSNRMSPAEYEIITSNLVAPVSVQYHTKITVILMWFWAESGAEGGGGLERGGGGFQKGYPLLWRQSCACIMCRSYN